MAEQILFDFAEKILSNLGSYALEQIGLACGVKTELKKLKNMITTIRNVLLDAQEQQVNNRAVKEWLEGLKLIFYDADDLLDDVATEALRRQVDAQKSMLREVRYFFTRSNPLIFRYAVGRKIKDIMERLDEIVREMEGFHLVVKAVERPFEFKRREETSSFIYIPEVIGRESEKEDLIELLLSSSVEENVGIIPVVGMGGLGKTTLAQFVYNDSRIGENFTKKIWVCVSDDFDVKGILVKLLKVAGENINNNEEFEHLQFRVREMLSREKCFLVLDDVWNKDRIKWEKLKSLLMTGARGSRIVVTTRDKEVASIVCTMNPYELKGLPDDDCLAILVEWAFQKGEESKHPNLINIGREIVKKCGGVPLAARTLGAFLFLKTNEHDWLFVRDNEMWAKLQGENDIVPVLKLSYNEMPSYLKQCFAYCSLFEKDAVIGKGELMYHWMAHGFLQSSNGDGELEHIGEEYIDELVRRSFLQPKYDGGAYTMHDLVHDLAQYVAGNECFIVKGATTEVIPDRVQHVAFDSSSCRGFPRALIKAKKLRTIILPKEEGFFSHNNEDPIFESSFEAVISSFRCLRVLDADGIHVNVLPKKIGKLNHLRYLGVSGVEALPKSLCKLLNLQFLGILGASLHELPKDFGKLVNLRFLGLSTRLTCLPEKGIRGLTSLRVLGLVDNPELRSLGEGIQHLTGLRILALSECPKLVSLPAGLKHLISLELLGIEYCEDLELSEEDDLRGLRSLTRLVLCNLPKLVTLPKGLQDAAATLTHLELRLCEGLTTLSESLLPDLQSLQMLKIGGCPNLVSLPEGMQRLTKLRRLSINNCDHLSGRCKEGVGEDWSKIAHVPEIYVDFVKIKPT